MGRVDSIKEQAYDVMWNLGIRVREVVKRTPFLDPLEEILRRAGPHLIPPPAADTEVALPSGMKMIVPAGLPNARSFATGRYEREVAKAFASIISSGMNVAIVGAGVGYHPLLASPLIGPQGRIHAFEPDLRNYAYLQRNIHSNACHNVAPVNKAVSNCSGSALFCQDRFGVEGHLTERRSPDSIPIETASLDDYFAGVGWPRLDVLMIDVEGAEEKVLQGMTKLSKDNPQLKLLLELHVRFIQRDGGSVDAVAALLDQLGFAQAYVIDKELKLCSFPASLPSQRNAYDLLLVKDSSTISLTP